jgi:hypothetical protein
VRHLPAHIHAALGWSAAQVERHVEARAELRWAGKACSPLLAAHKLGVWRAAKAKVLVPAHLCPLPGPTWPLLAQVAMSQKGQKRP